MVVLAALIAAVAPSAGAQRPQGAPDDGPRIEARSIEYEGRAAIPEFVLNNTLDHQASQCRLVLIAPLCKAFPTIFFIEKEWLDREMLGKDITRLRVLYWRAGYRHARIDTVITPRAGRAGHAAVDVLFRIDEGAPTTLGSLVVEHPDAILPRARMAELVRLREGAPLSIFQLDSTLSGIRDALWNLGYGDATVDTTMPPPDASGRVAMRLVVRAGPPTRVGEVRITGNTHVSNETLRRALLVRPGQPYRRSDLLESERHLMTQAPILRRALFVTPASGDTLKSLELAVREGPVAQMRVSGGFTTADYGQASVLLAHRDFLGGARRAEVRAAAGNLFAWALAGTFPFRAAPGGDDPLLAPAWQTSLDLVQPWAWSPGSAAGITLFAGRRVLPGVVADRSAGASLQLRHEVSTRFPLGAGWRVEQIRAEGGDVYFCAAFGVCDAGAAAALRGSHRLSPVSASAWRDRTDDLENPTTGTVGGVDVEHASAATRSDFAHTRVHGDAAYFRRTRPPRNPGWLPTVLALRARAGLARAHEGSDRVGDRLLHPRKRLYAGGAGSVRGYMENQLGPRVLRAGRGDLLAAGCTDATIADGRCDASRVPARRLEARPLGGGAVVEASVEWRHPLQRKMIAVGFVDAGWLGEAGVRPAGFRVGGRWDVTPGAGLRYRSPLGVFRLDLGMRLRGNERLPVLATTSDDPRTARVVALGEREWNPVEHRNVVGRVLGRTTLHFSMGQAF